MTNKTITLKGRVFIEFKVKAVTGLHIGGSDSGIEIGGVDKTVIRDPLTGRPYIPGSSFKGKMRSLLEKYQGLEQNQRIGQGCIHSCQTPDAYEACPLCQVFGVPGERSFGGPTRLVVRDIHLSDEEANKITERARTDLPYTESKTEVSIDRVTSAANPRQMERVVAGAVFGPGTMVYTIYEGAGCDPAKDIERLRMLVEGLQLLEDDYLGGLGSRGSGQIRLEGIRLKVRSQKDYLREPISIVEPPFDSLRKLVGELDKVNKEIKKQLGVS